MAKSYEERMLKVKNCGKEFIEFMDEDEKIVKLPKYCDDWLCIHCSKVKESKLIIAIKSAIDTEGLDYFYTLTTSDNVDTLEKTFKKLTDRLKMAIDEDYYYSKYKKSGNHKKFINDIFLCEELNIFLYEKNTYLNEVTNIDYLLDFIFNLMKNNLLDKYIKSITKAVGTHNIFKKIKCCDILERFEEYLDFNEILKAGLKNTFFRSVLYILFLMYIEYKLLDSSGDVLEIVEVAKKRLESVKMVNHLSYIRVFEVQGKCHFHIFFNCYVPFLIRLQIHSDTDYKDDISTIKNPQAVAEYVLKNIKEENTKASNCYIKKIRCVTSSNNIKLIQPVVPSGLKFHRIINGNIKGESTMESNFYTDRLSKLETMKQDKILELDKININTVEAKSDCSMIMGKELLNDIKDLTTYEISIILKAIKMKEKVNINDKYSRLLDIFLFQLIINEVERRKGIFTNVLPLRTNFNYECVEDKDQAEFLQSVLTENHSFTFLKGQAGTGKSTVISELINYIDTSECIIKIACPTGKAVDRIKKDVTDANVKISTIHSLLLSRRVQNDEQFEFYYNANNPINADLLIIDEVGLLQKEVLAHLLNSIPVSCKVLFCGDIYQLTPVKSQSIYEYSEIFDSSKTIMLHTNHRSKDDINILAHKLLKQFDNTVDFEDYSADLVKKAIIEGYQVICNTNNLVREINSMMTSEKQISFSDFKFDIGDRVIFNANDKRKRFANGTICEITKYNKEKCKMKFINQTTGKNFLIDLNKCDKNLFSPAFAITIHKFQGSEAEKVLVIFGHAPNLLNTNIAYTAVTRARSNVKIMLEEESDKYLLFNNFVTTKKQTTELIGEAYNPSTQTIEDLVYFFKTKQNNKYEAILD